MTDRRELDNTMEINSILEEAHGRKNAPAGADGSDAAGYGDDSFVFVDEDGAATPSRAARPASRKASKKPMILSMVIVGVILIGGIVGFIIWNSSRQPEPNVAGNVVVSGVDIGGMSYEDALAALAPAEQKLADAIRVEVVCGDQTLVFTKDDLALRFNTEELLKEAQQSAGSRSYEIRMSVDDDAVAALAEKAAAQIDREAQNAKVASFASDKPEMFTYAEAVDGQKLDQADLIAQLRQLFADGKLSGKVAAKCEVTKPAYDAAYLRQHITLLSSFTTESTNTDNGMSNQALALAACNNSIIEPGATWSFNQCTGDTNLESNGYKPAGVIVEGRHEIGIGGGICQSSTTIYNAAVLCGMEIVERYEHYYPSSYVDYGRDATIDYGNLDLKLKNPFDHQVFLKCWMDGVILHAELYGLPEKDFDRITFNTTEPTYTKTSYTVKASRTYYKDGKAVRTEALPSSTYYFSAPSTPTAAPTTAPTAAPTTVPTTPASDLPTAPIVPSTDNPIDVPSENPGGDPTDDPGENLGDDPPENSSETGGQD